MENKNTMQHIHEKNPWRTLIALSVFIVILIVGFFTMYHPEFTFKKDMNESLEDLKSKDAYFYPWQLIDVINQQEKNVILIDIRDKFIYGQGNIPGSENISAFDLTETENFERLQDLKNGNITVVLYGEDQLQANGPWMIFRELGFDNVKILMGGYQYYKKNKETLAESKSDTTFLKGQPNTDFAKVIADMSGGEVITTVKKEPVVVTRQAKTKAASGGC